jgi:oligoribonuclease NrnB/cAMP/cGMP phosphodiesterase (DHH superfamily)
MYKLITHNDLDGLGCAILAKLAFGDNVDIEYISKPDDTTKVLNELIDNNLLNTFDSVFVTDCSFDISLADKLKDKVKLFDHHQTADEFNKFNWATVKEQINGRNTCGTELWHNYLMRKGYLPFPRNFFVEQVRLYDTWDWSLSASKLPKYLNDVIYLDGLASFVDTFVDRLSRHDVNELTIFSQRERELLDREQTRIQKYVNKKNKAVRIVEVDGKKIAINFADENQSVVGNTVCNTYDVDYTMMMSLDKNLISFRSADDGEDVSAIAKKYDGGGHPHAAGCSINENLIDMFITNVINQCFTGDVTIHSDTEKFLKK